MHPGVPLLCTAARGRSEGFERPSSIIDGLKSLKPKGPSSDDGFGRLLPLPWRQAWPFIIGSRRMRLS